MDSVSERFLGLPGRGEKMTAKLIVVFPHGDVRELFEGTLQAAEAVCKAEIARGALRARLEDLEGETLLAVRRQERNPSPSRLTAAEKSARETERRGRPRARAGRGGGLANPPKGGNKRK
jgi:hypothetical protein